MVSKLDRAIKRIIHNDLLLEEEQDLYENKTHELTCLKDILEKCKTNYKDYSKLCKFLLTRIQEKYPSIEKIRIIKNAFDENTRIAFSSSEKFISEIYPNPRFFEVCEYDNDFYVINVRNNADSLKIKTFLEDIRSELIEAQNYASTNPFVEWQHFYTISHNYKVWLRDDEMVVNFNSNILDEMDKNFFLAYHYEEDEYKIETNIAGCRKLMNRDFEDDINKKVIPGKQLLYSKLKVNSLILPEHLR